jgi:hypothetical protein
MVPVGYKAKRVSKRPDQLLSPQLIDVFSVSSCISKDFAEYIDYWKHNGYWFFDSPRMIRSVALDHSISLEGLSLFYYEVYELEFDGERWNAFKPEPSFLTNVIAPASKQMEGFDVVTFSCGTLPECSPFSCNYMANEIRTNPHCLLVNFDEAKTLLQGGTFNGSEPGLYRIFSVYSVDWP